MRCFIAIDIPAGIKTLMGDVIRKCASMSKGVRWVPLENIHLTLKFLGEVKDGLIPEINERLSAVCGNHGPFSLDIRGTGVFPNPKRPNVLWIGIEESESLNNLFLSVDGAMHGLGFEKEGRSFSPHLTIGRVNDRKGLDLMLKEFLNFSDTSFGSAHVDEVILMKSVLKPTGAEYSKTAALELNKKIPLP